MNREMLAIAAREPMLVRLDVSDGRARMACSYCQDSADLRDGSDVAVEILLFQEAHFDCDPHLRIP